MAVDGGLTVQKTRVRVTRTQLFESAEEGTQSTGLVENGGASDNPIAEIGEDTKRVMDGGLEAPKHTCKHTCACWSESEWRARSAKNIPPSTRVCSGWNVSRVFRQPEGALNERALTNLLTWACTHELES